MVPLPFGKHFVPEPFSSVPTATGWAQDRAPLTLPLSPQDADPSEEPQLGKAKSEYRNYTVSCRHRGAGLAALGGQRDGVSPPQPTPEGRAPRA